MLVMLPSCERHSRRVVYAVFMSLALVSEGVLSAVAVKTGLEAESVIQIGAKRQSGGGEADKSKTMELGRCLRTEWSGPDSGPPCDRHTFEIDQRDP